MSFVLVCVVRVYVADSTVIFSSNLISNSNGLLRQTCLVLATADYVQECADHSRAILICSTPSYLPSLSLRATKSKAAW